MRTRSAIASLLFAAATTAAPEARAATDAPVSAKPDTAVATTSTPDSEASTLDADVIDKSARDALVDGKYTFCTNPQRPLGGRQRDLCELGAELEGCAGFAKACAEGQLPKDTGWLERLVAWAAPLVRVLLYLLILGIVVIVAFPVVRAIAKLRRDRRLTANQPLAMNVAARVEETPPETPGLSDAEAALRRAEEHRARGELSAALGLYLAASLAALDRRGAIRVARHRTNGEYVRACEEESSRAPLREIVREVDKVDFGGAQPTDEGVHRVAARAVAIVRVTTMALMLAALCVGCAGARRGADPAGDDLPVDVLRKSGFVVGKLATSLATLPIPSATDVAPTVIIDVERVALEDEAAAHLMRWVEAGGVLVLFGHVERWPEGLRPKPEQAETRDLVLRLPAVDEPDVDETDDDTTPASVDPLEIKGARAARRDAFSWKPPQPSDAESLAFLGDKTYAAKRTLGKGIVLGVANDDLFTNVGVLPRRNAAVLVALVRAAAHDPRRLRPATASPAQIGDVRVARAEDGIPPPANPFAALIAAGLGKGAWHALAAAVLLFLAYGVRHARARPAAKRRRRAFAEHVEATGAFYGRTRAHVHALAAYGQFVEMRLRESLPRGVDPASFLARASGVDAARATELLKRATETKAGDDPQGDELALIEELRQAMGKLDSSRATRP